MKGQYFVLLYAKLSSNAQISWSSSTSLRKTMPRHCTVKVWYTYEGCWLWLYLARARRRDAIAEPCLLMTSSQTSCRELQGRIVSSDTVHMLNSKLFVPACLGDSCRAMKLIWGWGSRRQMDCLQTAGDPLFPLRLKACFSRGGQLTSTERQEEAQQTSCLLLLSGLCSLFWSVYSPLMAKSDSPLVSQAVVAGARGWPVLANLWGMKPQVQACSQLPSTALIWGLPQLFLQLRLLGFLLHLQGNAPVPRWLGERAIAKLDKARQWRQTGKSAQVLVLPESVSPVYLLTEALCPRHCCTATLPSPWNNRCPLPGFYPSQLLIIFCRLVAMKPQSMQKCVCSCVDAAEHG